MNITKEDMLNMTKEEIIERHGFGKYKSIAINLLKDIIDILNDFNINYFIISGTLLGKIRHDDFIPWDDDIDLIVDKSILNKLDNIYNKYGDKINLGMKWDSFVKVCYKDIGNEIVNHWKYCLLGKKRSYRWPFIDLFVYDENDEKLLFFKKEWDKNNFFPYVETNFVGLNVRIPNNPDYFLKINYGENYMKDYKITKYSHKIENKIMNNKICLNEKEYNKLFYINGI